MKPACLLLATLAVLAVPSTARASCTFGSVSIWPDSGTLPANAKIVVNGWQSRRDFVASIATRNPRLIGEKRKFPLKIVESFETGTDDVPRFWNYAVELEPAVRLKPGTKVRLAFDGLEPTIAVSPDWTVGPALREPLKWSGPLKLESPCTMVAAVDSDALFIIEISQGDKTQRYPVGFWWPPKHQLSICPDRCGGAFLFGPGTKTVRVTALDTGGHKVPAPGPPLEVP